MLKRNKNCISSSIQVGLAFPASSHPFCPLLLSDGSLSLRPWVLILYSARGVIQTQAMTTVPSSEEENRNQKHKTGPQKQTQELNSVPRLEGWRKIDTCQCMAGSHSDPPQGWGSRGQGHKARRALTHHYLVKNATSHLGQVLSPQFFFNWIYSFHYLPGSVLSALQILCFS